MKRMLKSSLLLQAGTCLAKCDGMALDIGRIKGLRQRLGVVTNAIQCLMSNTFGPDGGTKTHSQIHASFSSMNFKVSCRLKLGSGPVAA